MYYTSRHATAKGHTDRPILVIDLQTDTRPPKLKVKVTKPDMGNVLPDTQTDLYLYV